VKLPRMMHKSGTFGLLTVLVALILSMSAIPASNALALELTHDVTGTVTLDGDPVDDAKVVAIPGDTLLNADTSLDGNYTLALPAGDYSLSVRPKEITTTSPDWVFTGQPLEVTVPPSQSDQDFEVTAATVTVSGTVLAPQGEELNENNRVWIRAENQEGQGNTVQVDNTTGEFVVKALPGAVLIRVIIENNMWTDPTQLSGLVYFADAGDTVIVDGDPATSNADDPIQLVKKTSTISGSVTVLGATPDAQPSPTAGIPVHAWRLDAAEFVSTLTGLDGNYALPVIAGTWMVRAVPLPNQDFVPAESPQRVFVAEDEVASVNLKVAAVDVTVNGRAVDSLSGEPVEDLRGRAYTLYRNADGQISAGPTAALQNDGSFRLRLASTVATSYTVGIYLPPSEGFTTAGRSRITTDSVPNPLDIPIIADNSTISGSLVDSEGTPITGVAGAVYGVSNSGGWARTRVNPDTGGYEMEVVSVENSGQGGSTWLVHGFVDPTSGYIVQARSRQAVFLAYNNGNGSDVSDIDFRLLNFADFGRIEGKVRGPGGLGIPGVRVSLTETGVASGVTRWAYTNRLGDFTVRVPAGTYQIIAHTPLPRLLENWIAPAPQRVSVAAQQAATANLRFRASDVTVTGTVTYQPEGGSEPVGFPALVRARAADGTTVHVPTQRATNNSAVPASPQLAINGTVITGTYSLKLLTGLEWTIEAVSSSGADGSAPDENKFLRSEKTVITLDNGTNPPVVDLALEEVSDLPESQIFAFAAGEAQLFTMADGSTVQSPPGAFAETGNVLLTVRPLPELEGTSDVEPVSFGYRLHAFDEDGKPITRFLQSITIEIPYTDAQLAALGISEDQLVPSYWDAATSSWKPVENVAVVPNDDDEGGGVVLITTDHFTDYALMGATEEIYHLPLVLR
jgi:hypothetical protein